ncbi:MAG: ArsR/SmtB family transcription factor [Acidobacteriota bacterium]
MATNSSIESEHLQRAADILKTVAHPVRLRIIDLLEAGERTVSDLCRALEAPQPYTSQQLNLMKAKGVLSARRDGNQVFYSIANKSVVKVIHCVRSQSEAMANKTDGAAQCAGSASDV